MNGETIGASIANGAPLHNRSQIAMASYGFDVPVVVPLKRLFPQFGGSNWLLPDPAMRSIATYNRFGRRFP